MLPYFGTILHDCILDCTMFLHFETVLCDCILDCIVTPYFETWPSPTSTKRNNLILLFQESGLTLYHVTLSYCFTWVHTRKCLLYCIVWLSIKNILCNCILDCIIRLYFQVLSHILKIEEACQTVLCVWLFLYFIVIVLSASGYNTIRLLDSFAWLCFQSIMWLCFQSIMWLFSMYYVTLFCTVAPELSR